MRFLFLSANGRNKKHTDPKKIDQKTKQLFDETAKRIMKYFLPFALKTKNSTDRYRLTILFMDGKKEEDDGDVDEKKRKRLRGKCIITVIIIISNNITT